MFEDVEIRKNGAAYSLTINGKTYLSSASYSECLGELVRMSLEVE